MDCIHLEVIINFVRKCLHFGIRIVTPTCFGKTFSHTINRNFALPFLLNMHVRFSSCNAKVRMPWAWTPATVLSRHIHTRRSLSRISGKHRRITFPVCIDYSLRIWEGTLWLCAPPPTFLLFCFSGRWNLWTCSALSLNFIQNLKRTHFTHTALLVWIGGK